MDRILNSKFRRFMITTQEMIDSGFFTDSTIQNEVAEDILPLIKRAFATYLKNNEWVTSDDHYICGCIYRIV